MKSYAQNFEDVILMRALKHVGIGFYVDIGAYHPVKHSVSLAFYEKGWRGIHVEPSPNAASELRLARFDEDVIEAVCSSQRDDMAFMIVGDTGLSTAVLQNAEKAAADHHDLREINVPTITLATVLEKAVSPDIHWLKVDVEGMELDVLQSWGTCAVRPWICVVESTKPNSQEENFKEWENELTERGYVFAYFDGLNRFYVHESQRVLLRYFGPGPNVFDLFSITEFNPAAGYLLQERESAIKRIRQQYEAAIQQNSELIQHYNELKRKLHTLEAIQAATKATNEYLTTELLTSQGRLRSSYFWFLGKLRRAALWDENRSRAAHFSSGGELRRKAEERKSGVRNFWKRKRQGVFPSTEQLTQNLTDQSCERSAESILSAIRKEQALLKQATDMSAGV